MDTLALLCNLYGDGPATLRRLREAGCGTLAALDALESDRLASLLRTSARAARRFQVEGRLLRERSEAALERAPASSAAVASDAPPAGPGAQDPLIGKVLTAWRDRDEEGSPRAVPAARPAPSARSAPPSAATGAQAGLEQLGELDAALRASLASCGVRTLGQLIDADALKLASQGRIGFTRLLHLQFLARRALAACPRPQPHDDVLVPQPPPGERRGAARGPAAGQPVPEGPQAASQAASPPPGTARFSPAERPSRPADPDPDFELELELERFAREARAALEQGAAGAPLPDEGGSGPFA